jgi:hypothetical protein
MLRLQAFADWCNRAGQAEETGHSRDQRGAGQPEGADTDAGQVTDTEEEEDLTEREHEILQALLILKATGKKRSVSRHRAAKKADPAAKPASYNKAIASLVAKELVESKPGPGGGIWLTPAGVQAAESLPRLGS